MATRDDGPQIKAELDKAVSQLGQAMQRISDLYDELSTIRDIAYRAGSGDAAADALSAIHERASRAVKLGG
ncbi:hypothetical protein ACWKSP_22225 [Micromonosporaceae bacterium Da 78-11]